MNITTDSDAYDSHQMELIHLIAKEVKQAFTEAGVSPDKLQEAAESLTFDLGAILDGSRVMTLNGKSFMPVITFALNEDGTDLLAPEGGSFMHEYAHGVVADLFEPDAGGDE